MSDRETGVKPVPVDELPAFAEALGTSVAYLMGLTDDRSRPLEDAAAEALRTTRGRNDEAPGRRAAGGGSLFMPRLDNQSALSPLAPPIGLEPITLRLTVACSAS